MIYNHMTDIYNRMRWIRDMRHYTLEGLKAAKYTLIIRGILAF